MLATGNNNNNNNNNNRSTRRGLTNKIQCNKPSAQKETVKADCDNNMTRQ
jgi:hypothetical protein